MSKSGTSKPLRSEYDIDYHSDDEVKPDVEVKDEDEDGEGYVDVDDDGHPDVGLPEDEIADPYESRRDSDTETSPFGDLFWSAENETRVRNLVTDPYPYAKFGIFLCEYGVQVFSVKIKRVSESIVSEADGSYLLFGNIRSRDGLEFGRNYLFRLQKDQCMPVKVGDTLPLMGPLRPITSYGWVYFEVNLNVKQPTGAKPLSKDVLSFETDDHSYDDIKTVIAWGKYGAVELRYAVFNDTAQARVEIVATSGRKDGLRGRVVAWIEGYSEPIVLFNSERMGEDITFDDEGRMKLWCSVVAVPNNSDLRLKVKLYDPNGEDNASSSGSSPTKILLFHPNKSFYRPEPWTTELSFQFGATMQVKVYWLPIFL